MWNACRSAMTTEWKEDERSVFPSEKYLLFTLIVVTLANFFYELSLIFYNSILKRIAEQKDLGKFSGFSFK